MDIFVWPYNSNSRSARDLANTLNTRIIRRQNSSVVDKTDRMIINWGDSSRCPYSTAKVLNKPQAVALAANKYDCFRAIDNANYRKAETDPTFIHTPQWTVQPSVAEIWCNGRLKVCSRTILNGNSGQGLIISNRWLDHPNNAPLYTKYVDKTAEYRVHVICGIVVEVQKKVWPAKRSSVGVDFTQRNHSDGFVFQSCKFNEVNFKILKQAINVVKALGLDFAGVDVIWSTEQKAYVLEVNTAPGIEGKDLTVYANSFRDIALSLSQS